MKKITIYAALALAGMVSLTSCNKKKGKDKKAPEVALHTEFMDTLARPQDDFFKYVNGLWFEKTKIPSDKASWGSFNELRERTDDASLKILDKILDEKFEKGTEGQKIKDLYASFMNWDKRNKLGISPIKEDLAKIDAIQSIDDLQKYMLTATKEGDNIFYGWGVYADMKDSNMNAIYLGGPALGLGRDYYQKKSEDNTKALAEYEKYATKLLKIIGYENAGEVAHNIVELEKELANTLLTNVESRDANKRYNLKTTAELSALVKNIDLANYLKEVGVNTDKVIIGELNYYKNLDKYLTNDNLPLLKNYMKYNIIKGASGYLTKELDDINFDFYAKYLRGQKEQRPMNKRALSLINGVLGEAFGKLYVKEYFSEDAKKKMQTYIDYLLKAYKKRINNLDWMSDETKAKAQEKLAKFTVKIAYPDKWEDYSKLAINAENDLYQNLKAVTKWSYDEDLKEVGKPVDKTKWGMSPQTVNAYYNPSYNEIVFPAAILQTPFFNFDADPAVNFGGIGAVIGHEISHGFDDSGARFDGDGNLNNWWTAQDKANFDKKVAQLAKQYDQYEPVKGSFVNGKFTSGENIGDLGGVEVAFEALQMYLKDHPVKEEKIDGFTQNQRFFLSWATVWRTKSTDEYMRNQVKTDPHSPGYFRSFAPLLNVDGFHEAFGTKEGDKLYKAPKDRIRIW
ncbi:MAG: endothelin-converting protein [Flavobacteriales bacterium]|nr:MAG: endothelin-converting protein [Flavobacteriales bacterium]